MDSLFRRSVAVTGKSLKILELGDVFFVIKMDSSHGNWIGGIVGMGGGG